MRTLLAILASSLLATTSAAQDELYSTPQGYYAPMPDYRNPPPDDAWRFQRYPMQPTYPAVTPSYVLDRPAHLQDLENYLTLFPLHESRGDEQR